MSKDRLLQNLTLKWNTKRFQNGQRVISSGEISEVLYIVKTGSFKSYIENNHINSFGKLITKKEEISEICIGDLCGEEGVLFNELNTYTMIVESQDAECYFISEGDFRRRFGDLIP
jgi:CRP-like cAMP-binding protein